MTDGPVSIVFDRIADEYDETRGGEERGQIMAAALDRHLPDAGPVLEVGVGTGLVALGMMRLGHRVVGVDLSEPMARKARRRIGRRVAVADALRLPLRPGTIPAAYAVWVLHVVADVRAALAEIARVLQPGGRLLVVPGTPAAEPTDVMDLVAPMLQRFRPRRDGIDDLRTAGARVGLQLVEVGELPMPPAGLSPRQMADRVERRTYSALWNVDQESWRTHVEPVIARLRALPEPEAPRLASNTYSILVLRRP